MSFEAYLAVAIVLGTTAALILTRIAPDVIMVGALTVLMATGILTAEQALAGLSNPGLVTVAVLFAVVAGLRDTGSIQSFGLRLLGHPKSTAGAQLRLMIPAGTMSAVLNNTPIVAVMVPLVEEWCKRHKLSVSKLMIPLSYATIFGGTCTLIGTSTNLIVAGLVRTETDLGRIGMFDIAWVGLPCAIVGVGFVILASPWLLPTRRAPRENLENPREYSIEMLVEPDSPLVGKTIEEAGLRHLPGAFVAEIERKGTVIAAVGPTERLQADDRLLFVGIVESVVDLVKTKGLVPAPDQLFKLSGPRAERSLFEAVVAPASPVAGMTIRAGRFRTRYGAVVIAVSRNGERLTGKLGDIVLRPGDTALLEANAEFGERHRNSRDFLLISPIAGAAPPRHDRAGTAGAILVGMVIVVSFGILPMLEAALIAAGLMLATGCTTGASARASVDWSVLTVIGAAFGLGEALRSTGAAEAIASAWLAAAGSDPWLALIAVYVITSVLTAMITNNAAAVLVFPIAKATAAGLDVSLWPFVICIMVAASASFATPIGYQTNLMVYGPGGYRFTDYVRIGLPLSLLLGVTTILITPRVWPF